MADLDLLKLNQITKEYYALSIGRWNDDKRNIKAPIFKYINNETKQNKTKNKEKNDTKFIFSEFNLLVNAENVIEVN